MTNFSYNPDIPDGPNNPSADQPKMKINTNSTADIIDVDHVGFEQDNGGIHRQVNFTQDFPVAPLIPALAVANYFPDKKFVATYANNNSWPFWQNAGGSELQVGPSLNQLNNGYILIGAYMIQWGVATKLTDGSVLFTPNFAVTPYSIQITVFENNNNRHSVHVKTASAANFTVASRDSSGSDESNTFDWIAIGLRL